MAGYAESVKCRARKWGDGIGIYLPKTVCNYLNIVADDELLVTVISLKGNPAPISYEDYRALAIDERMMRRERRD